AALIPASSRKKKGGDERNRAATTRDLGGESQGSRRPHPGGPPFLKIPRLGYRRAELCLREMGMEESAGGAARQAKESLELAFQMSQILDTGLDRHTLSLLMALCDRGTNPEALAALVRELSSTAPPSASAPTAPASNAVAAPTAPSLFPSGFRQL
uniref:Mitotic-spindle organizing protein 1 n=2 Tax=Triticum urartu TaxID=4572 RepID=A0A8R7P3C0_TRIUA